MGLIVVDNSLVKTALTALRDKDTPPENFRKLAATVATVVAAEAARNLPLRIAPVKTPIETTDGYYFERGLIAVPVLRAGLGMLEPVLELLPFAKVGYLGLERNEETAVASVYYSKLPPLEGSDVWILDPMLATGGSSARAAEILYSAGAESISLLCIVAAPEGVALLKREHPDIQIITASLDRELNTKKYIMPGLGDFGDRLFGTV